MRIPQLRLGAAFFLLVFSTAVVWAQAPSAAAILQSLSAEGSHLPEAQILAETGFKIGDTITKDQIQAAADRLGHLGLFSKVTYDYRTRVDGMSLTFHLEDAPRVPVLFDNIPWFTDGEIADQVRKTVPSYDGKAPLGGSILDRIGEGLRTLLAAHKLDVTVEHQVTDNPLGEGQVQLFKISGAAVKIARLEFSDAIASSSRAFQQHLGEILGKPYSRMTIGLFLTEQVRPLYLQQGYLRAQLGPPEIRLTGNPNRPLPEALPVFVPVVTGPQYHWNGVEWSGNSAITAAALTGDLGRRLGEIANGYEIEASWDRVRDAYGHVGYLETQLDPHPVFDDATRTVRYRVAVTEGQQFRFNEMTLTGVSLTAERLIRASWPIAKGQAFDKTIFEEFLIKLGRKSPAIFGELPIHFDEVGHWLRTDAQKGTVDVLLDFK